MLGYQSNIGRRRDVGRWSDVWRRRRGRAGVRGFRRKFVARLAIGAKTAYQPLYLLLGRDRPVLVLAQLLAGSTCRPPFKPIEHCTILQSSAQPVQPAREPHSTRQRSSPGPTLAAMPGQNVYL